MAARTGASSQLLHALYFSQAIFEGAAMKALAYVSDEKYVALADVAGEFESEESGEIVLLRSSPRGAFYGDLKPGRYRVTLSKRGFGSKISTADLGGETPF